jgi:hypothetical protein
VVHADHEQNASTSTVRIAGSSMANPFACIAAGIGSLYGDHAMVAPIRLCLLCLNNYMLITLALMKSLGRLKTKTPTFD